MRSMFTPPQQVPSAPMLQSQVPVTNIQQLAALLAPQGGQGAPSQPTGLGGLNLQALMQMMQQKQGESPGFTGALPTGAGAGAIPGATGGY